MKKGKVRFYSPMQKTMVTILIIAIVLCLVFSCFYCYFSVNWLKSVAITFGIVAYHFLIRFASPVILLTFFRKKYNYKSKWFQPKSCEQNLYNFLKVKKWKSYIFIFTYNPNEFSLKIHNADEVVNNMCHAEAVHELIVALCFTSLLFAIPFGAFWVFLITAVLSALFDCIFVIIQRYNRPRVVQVLEKKGKL
jgi:hypothetical protein